MSFPISQFIPLPTFAPWFFFYFLIKVVHHYQQIVGEHLRVYPAMRSDGKLGDIMGNVQALELGRIIFGL